MTYIDGGTSRRGWLMNGSFHTPTVHGRHDRVREKAASTSRPSERPNPRHQPLEKARGACAELRVVVTLQRIQALQRFGLHNLPTHSRAWW